MARLPLPKRARETMSALIEVVMPRGGIYHHDLRAEMLAYVEDSLVFLPPDLRTLFPVGLLLLEYGTLPLMGSLTPFSRMTLEHREHYIEGWVNSRIGLRRDLIKGVKALAVMAYFEHPAVKEQLGFMSDEWVTSKGNERLERYGDEIARIEADIA